MDALTPDIRETSPADPQVAPLIFNHLSLMRVSSPPCSVHALDSAGLNGAGARFFAMIDGDRAVAMGALARVGQEHGELKSMHVAEAVRGRGLGRSMLERLIAEARAAGMDRVSLETGSQPVFAPARAMYASAGFRPCGPFGSYGADPNSAFMTRAL